MSAINIPELLDRIVELKKFAKDNPDARREIAATKKLLTETVAASDFAEVTAEFQNWLSLHPNEKHAEQLLKRLTEQRHD